MAIEPLSPRKSLGNPATADDCRMEAEAEFAQLARVYRYSIITGDPKLRALAFRDMMAVPIFTIESLKQKVDAMRCEDGREWLIDRNMTARQVIALDTVRVASGMPA